MISVVIKVFPDFPYYQGITLGGAVTLLLALVFMLLIKRVISKSPTKFPDTEPLELENYTLGFEALPTIQKRPSLFAKIVAIILIILLVLIPINELIDIFGIQ